MSITAQSADGVIHEFPDGTPQEVINAAMKRYAQGSAPVAERAPGEGVTGTIADIAQGLYLGARQPLDVAAARLERLFPGSAQFGQSLGFRPAADILREQQTARAVSPANISETIGQGIGVVPFLAAGGIPAAPTTFGGAALAGGATGALTSEQETLGGVAAETATGAALGVPGKVLGDVVGGVIAPRVSESVRKLRDLGVELTPGGVLGARGDAFGRLANVAESALTSVPGLGALVDYARGRTSETFEKAALKQLGDVVGVNVPDNLSGGQAVSWLRKNISDAYERVVPSLSMRLPTNWQNDALDIFDNLNLPDNRKELLDDYLGVVSQTIEKVEKNGVIEGKNLQNALSSLGDNARTLMRSSDGFERRVGAGLNEFRNWMVTTLAGQNKDAAGELLSLNKAWNAQAVLDKATSYASDAITPVTLNRAVKSLNKGRTQGFYGELAQAGQDIPRALQDSGTATRLATMQALGLTGAAAGGAGLYATGGGAPDLTTTGGTLATLAALYSPAGRRAVQGILTREAGPAAQALAAGTRALATPTAATLAAEPAVTPTAATTFSVTLPDGTDVPFVAPPGASAEQQMNIAFEWLRANRPDLIRAGGPGVSINYGG